MKEKPKVYIETSVVSYLAARPSRDFVIAARQIITNEWWEHEISRFTPCISRPVVDEAERGDVEASKCRMEKLKGFVFLEENDQITELAQTYLKYTNLPERCYLDCLHMATASFHSMDFLLSWNCKHIVNPVIVEKIRRVNTALGLSTPGICTPESLFGDSDEQ